MQEPTIPILPDTLNELLKNSNVSVINADALKNLPPFKLTIDKIDPATPLEERPIQVDFTIHNFTRDLVNGMVGSTAVSIPAHSKVSATTSDTAPTAGTAQEYTLYFYKTPRPTYPEFPPPDAEARAMIDVAASYVLGLVSFKIGRTRARHNDTDFVSMAAQVGAGEPIADTVFVGDVNDGDHNVNLHLDALESVPGTSPDLVISYVILNHGHDGQDADTVLKVTNGISTVTKTALEVEYSGDTIWWELGNQFTQWLNGLFVGWIWANCDGVVAADKITVSSSQLYEWTGGNDRIKPNLSHFETRHYDGTDSPDGCGRNSIYDVTWDIIRALP